MNFLEVSGIARREGELQILNGISFVQQRFQKLGLAGTTGSGKTTLLKIIAGLTQSQEGSVRLNGALVPGPEEKLIPGHPEIAYLSQHFELRNHYRVEEILTLRAKEVERIAKLCRIDHLLKRWTNQISGGERQRVALAALLVSSPTLLLLDEPYSNLDAIHKKILKSVIEDVCLELGITCILVSHEASDLLSWADAIMVLDSGTVAQLGTPEEIYFQPQNSGVASLFGSFTIVNDSLKEAFGGQIPVKTTVIRPSGFRIDRNGSGLKGIVKKVDFMGGHYEITIDSIAGNLIVLHHAPIEKGSVVGVELTYLYGEENSYSLSGLKTKS